MDKPESTLPLGYPELLRLCDRVPVHRISWPAPCLEWADVIEMAGKLRARLWRQHCAARHGNIPSCIDRKLRCQEPEHCLADRWLPDATTTRTASWRMATTFIRLDPPSGELVLWVLGNLNSAECESLVGAMRPWVGEQPCRHKTGKLSEFAPVACDRYRMELTTPWVFAKKSPATEVPPAIGDFAIRLRDSAVPRMHKFVALTCQFPQAGLPEEIARLVCFASQYVSRHVLERDLSVETTNLQLQGYRVPSGSNGKLVPHWIVTGEVVISIKKHALPWLALFAMVGGGKAADKGFGGVSFKASQ